MKHPTREAIGLIALSRKFGEAYTPNSFTMKDWEAVAKQMELAQPLTKIVLWGDEDQHLVMFGSPEEKEAAGERISARVLKYKLQEIESYRQKLSPETFEAYLWLEEKYGRNRDARWMIRTLLAPPPRDNDYMDPEYPEVIMKGEFFKIKAGFGDGYDWEDVAYFNAVTAKQLPFAIKRLKKIKGFKTVRK